MGFGLHLEGFGELDILFLEFVEPRDRCIGRGRAIDKRVLPSLDFVAESIQRDQFLGDGPLAIGELGSLGFQHRTIIRDLGSLDVNILL